MALGVIGGRTLPIKSIWDKSWGCPLFNATMPRWRFLKIIKIPRFDLKTERRRTFGKEKVLLGIFAVGSIIKGFPEGLRFQREYNHR